MFFKIGKTGWAWGKTLFYSPTYFLESSHNYWGASIDLSLLNDISFSFNTIANDLINITNLNYFDEKLRAYWLSTECIFPIGEFNFLISYISNGSRTNEIKVGGGSSISVQSWPLLAIEICYNYNLNNASNNFWKILFHFQYTFFDNFPFSFDYYISTNQYITTSIAYEDMFIPWSFLILLNYSIEDNRGYLLWKLTLMPEDVNTSLSLQFTYFVNPLKEDIVKYKIEIIYEYKLKGDS